MNSIIPQTSLDEVECMKLSNPEDVPSDEVIRVQK
jgi:hypothetical protein